MTNKYTLEIVSSDNEKVYKKHNIDDLDIIGVYENEPFKIRFKNNTLKKVQVRVSVDGTDIITGEKASTSLDGRMWVVQAYGTLELKAWPEDNKGGAEFLFGKTEDSVAANTHGDLSAKGLIAVAVFEEQYEPPVYFNTGWNKGFNWTSGSSGGWGGTYGSSSGPIYRSNTSTSVDTKSFSKSSTHDIRMGEYIADCSNSVDYLCEDVGEAGPAVGAGDYQEQTIVKTAGLIEPKFAEVVQVKYEWWTSLKSKVRVAKPKFQAFPGDIEKGINLGSTPRLETEEGRLRRVKRTKTRLRPEEKYVEINRFI